MPRPIINRRFFMIDRINDKLISFMSKHIPKAALFLLWILLCLSLPPKSANASCSLVEPFQGNSYGVCTTEAEAQNFILDYKCDSIKTDSDSNGGGVINCCYNNIWQMYGQPPGTIICPFSVNWGGPCADDQKQSCTITFGDTIITGGTNTTGVTCPGTQICKSGKWGDCKLIDPCCGSKCSCCPSPDCGPTGGG